ncbi:MAG TPA: YjgP/YjgQ family permease [Cytophagales bacterium]|nr:YjgP/YjgQ family permease [Cytophagales bacterium]HAA21610.1 YjgP/YjgQ family permease [Cytophagales bacterium]HAP62837.1 YjgP/YjgQ family permease [Cytophagales bacterium]
MKRLDKLIIRAFFGPFLITLAVVVFIFLIRFLMQYFEEFLGKDLGIGIFAELFFYFAVNVTPQAYPLAVLLSSLIVFGNLGEHSELTAIKSAGISLLRSVRPIFIFVIALVAFVYYSNDKIVPQVNLKAYSLLYDIRKTKPGLDIKPGTFYDGLPDYSIKVSDNQNDGAYLENIIIYDHTRGRGNSDVIFAKTGSMETFLNDKYMRLTLYEGQSYSEQDEAASARRRHEAIHQFARTQFDTTVMVFDLSSFEIEQTDESLFAQHYKMKDTRTLNDDIDSMRMDRIEAMSANFENVSRYYRYHIGGYLDMPAELKDQYQWVYDARYVEEDSTVVDTTQKVTDEGAPTNPNITLAANRLVRDDDDPPSGEAETLATEGPDPAERKLALREIVEYDTALLASVDALSATVNNRQKVSKGAATSARYVKNNLNVQATKIENRDAQIRNFTVERGKKLSLAVSCFVMFLIGAPLGAIIKKGGLGVPVLISIGFFIIFYVFMSGGEKWGRQGIIEPILAVWLCNIVLLPFGLFFLRQARNDARLLENDFYLILWDRLRKRLGKKKAKKVAQVAT